MIAKLAISTRSKMATLSDLPTLQPTPNPYYFIHRIKRNIIPRETVIPIYLFTHGTHVSDSTTNTRSVVSVGGNMTKTIHFDTADTLKRCMPIIIITMFRKNNEYK